MPISAAGDTNPNRLWEIVQDRCVSAAKAHYGTGPCAALDLKQRIAVLKDLIGPNHYLLIPTDRITGIEDLPILASDVTASLTSY